MALGPVAIAGPKAGLWRDHESGEGGDLFTLIERFRGCEFAEAAAFAADMVGGAVIEPREPVKKAKRLDDERSRTEYALCLWQASRSITGTLAAIYLTELRRVDITQLPDIDDVLRFHPDCPFGIGERYPCLLALMRNVVTDAPTEIIRTAISTCGEKLGRKMLGRKQGAAVKLWPDTAVTTGLVVGEGSDCASAATRSNIAARVCSRLGRFAMPAILPTSRRFLASSFSRSWPTTMRAAPDNGPQKPACAVGSRPDKSKSYYRTSSATTSLI